MSYCLFRGYDEDAGHYTKKKKMSFSFNFPDPVKCSNTEIKILTGQLNSNNEENSSEIATVRKIESSSVDVKYLNAIKDRFKLIKIGEQSVKYIPSSAVFEVKQNLNLSYVPYISEESHSDLIPGVYEGGLKLWECSLDLASYLCSHNCLKAEIKVLELGCGPGIPGILAYLKGATVTFQDYNVEVLELVTMPNVIINTSDDSRSNISQLCNFISGDWKEVKNEYYESFKDENEKFDIILSSETIYEKSNHQKLLDLMKCSLKSSGIIYLAAKTYYFGVGGTLDDFQELVEKDDTFSWQLCYSSNDGVKRHIVKMNFKNVQIL